MQHMKHLRLGHLLLTLCIFAGVTGAQSASSLLVGCYLTSSIVFGNTTSSSTTSQGQLNISSTLSSTSISNTGSQSLPSTSTGLVTLSSFTSSSDDSSSFTSQPPSLTSTSSAGSSTTSSPPTSTPFYITVSGFGARLRRRAIIYVTFTESNAFLTPDEELAAMFVLTSEGQLETGDATVGTNGETGSLPLMQFPGSTQPSGYTWAFNGSTLIFGDNFAFSALEDGQMFVTFPGAQPPPGAVQLGLEQQSVQTASSSSMSNPTTSKATTTSSSLTSPMTSMSTTTSPSPTTEAMTTSTSETISTSSVGITGTTSNAVNTASSLGPGSSTTPSSLLSSQMTSRTPTVSPSSSTTTSSPSPKTTTTATTTISLTRINTSSSVAGTIASSAPQSSPVPSSSAVTSSLRSSTPTTVASSPSSTPQSSSVATSSTLSLSSTASSAQTTGVISSSMSSILPSTPTSASSPSRSTASTSSNVVPTSSSSSSPSSSTVPSGGVSTTTSASSATTVISSSIILNSTTSPAPSTITSFSLSSTTSLLTMTMNSTTRHFSGNFTRTRTSSSSTSSSSSTPTPYPAKRGLAYSNVTTLQYWTSPSSPYISWSYDYFSLPNASNNVGPYTYPSPPYRFIPLLYNDANSLTSIWSANVNFSIANYGADAIFGFNEPDASFSGMSANMPVAQSVAGYATFMQPFAGRVKIGAPAVTNAGSGLAYLAQFLGNATKQKTNLTLDFINIHWYASPYNIDYFESYLQSAYNLSALYSPNITSAFVDTARGAVLPVWVTEFGMDQSTYDAPTTVQFLKNATAFMDARPWVERYAWFGDFPSANGATDMLLNGDGSGGSVLGNTYFGFNGTN